MTFVKVVGIAMVAVVCYNVLKNVKPELSVGIIIAAGAVILAMLTEEVADSVTTFNVITEKSGLSTQTFTSVIKIIGIGYVAEYASAVCEDGGSKSLGQKIQFAGKITVFLLAVPIIINVFNVIENIL